MVISNIYMQAALNASRDVFKVGLNDFQKKEGRRCRRIEDAACILAARVMQAWGEGTPEAMQQRRNLAVLLHVTPPTVRVITRRYQDFMKYDAEFRSKDRLFAKAYNRLVAEGLRRREGRR